ncbi:MAG: ATP-grasp domain-containing protein [Dehalococcoidales bacterium]|nr:ATP-grasp domain-containing protein [Dehalococcoidales bacterium]
MRIGLSYDLKEAITSGRANLPEDAFEEYDYPATINYIASALEHAGNTIVRLDGGRQFIENILREKVDIVFNISEGRGTYRSREAQVPSILEMLDIPYTGADPECLAVCLDKPLTKKLVTLAGIATPPWLTVKNKNELDSVRWNEVAFPLIVKPAFEGSSKGVRLNSIANDKEKAVEVTLNLMELYHQPVMLEGFVKGDEVTVGIVGNSPPGVVGIMRILPKQQTEHFVYSLEVKRDWQNLVDYECPACLDKPILDRITTDSLKAFTILECRDFTRIDFRIGADGIPYFIEINPLPGLGDYSDLVIMAIKMGWSHEALIRAVLSAALERYPFCVQE